MTVLLVLVLMGVLFVTVALATGRGGAMAPVEPQRMPALPEGPLDAEALEQVRFAVGLRGYRMDEVDAVLDRLAGELARRDAEIARLTAMVGIEEPDAGADEAR